MAIDLSSVEGLTEAQITAITETHDNEVSGLKNKNDALITEQRAAKDLADKAAKDAKEAKDAAELAEARKAGDIKAVEERLATQAKEREEALSSELEKLNSEALGSVKSSVVTDLSSHFIAPESSKLILSQLVEVSRSESGEKITTFKAIDGTVLGTDPNSFIEYAGKHPELSEQMKPTGLDGSGAGGSKSTGGAGGQDNVQSRLGARLRKKGLTKG